MAFECTSRITKTDLLVIPLYAGKGPTSGQQEALEQYGHPDFGGKRDETLLFYQKNRLAPRILLVGLGEKENASTERWRQAGGNVAVCFKKPFAHITIVPPKEELNSLAAFLEGILLKHYRFQTFIKDAERRLSSVPSLRVILSQKKNQENLTARFKEIEKVTEAVKSVRDMVNTPSNHMRPFDLGQIAQKITRQRFRMKCTIFTPKKLQKMGMGCLLGVGQGAPQETRLIRLEYKYRPKNKKPIVLIGKGVCFDSGGINLKTQTLEEMKYDMAGAATMLGIFKLLAEHKLPLHVIGLAPCVINLPGNNPTKPGDILIAYDGTTVEVTNTDAEGRLILADAISYTIKHDQPEVIVDIATLTGAAIVALGYDITALMSNAKAWEERMERAAVDVDEKIWKLPLEENYKKHLKSPIADLSNFNPKPSAGTIMGGLFLEHFTKKTPWIHLDLGGSAWTKEDKPYSPQGASGTMVRTLWQFLKDYEVH